MEVIQCKRQGLLFGILMPWSQNRVKNLKFGKLTLVRVHVFLDGYFEKHQLYHHLSIVMCSSTYTNYYAKLVPAIKDTIEGKWENMETIRFLHTVLVCSVLLWLNTIEEELLLPIISHSPLLKEAKAGTQGRSSKQNPLRHTAYWLADNGLPILLSPATQYTCLSVAPPTVV